MGKLGVVGVVLVWLVALGPLLHAADEKESNPFWGYAAGERTYEQDPEEEAYLPYIETLPEMTDSGTKNEDVSPGLARALDADDPEKVRTRIASLARLSAALRRLKQNQNLVEEE